MTSAVSGPPGIGTLLPWDSDFFELHIARSETTESTAQELRTWARQHDVDLLYHLADVDPASINDLVLNGFRFVDLQMTFEVRLEKCGDTDNGDSIPVVHPASGPDIDALLPLARTAHVDSRFFADKNLADRRCEDLYAAWLFNSFNGFADIVLVANSHGDPSGYVTLSKSGSQGRIGLIAVAEEHRGKGLGRELVRAAKQWCLGADVHTLKVVTQGRNIGAQRLYQGLGMRTSSVRAWFHLWPSHG